MMTRRSGRWTAFKYLLALPALGLLVVAFAEPQVTMAQGAKTPGTVTVAPAEAKKIQFVDPTTVEEKKKLDAEYKAKIEKLKADYAAASDPEEKKAIEAKMQKVKQYYAQVKMTVDLSDPVAVEKLIAEISKKREVLKAKSAEITDPATQEKFQQELDQLAKMQHKLKAALAELKAGK